VQFDWFTVIAQIINFLILIFLLKHFLFDRVTGIMDEREKQISERIQSAENQQNKAEEKADEYSEKIDALDRERDQRLKDARDAAESRKKELLQSARDDVEQRQKAWRDTVMKERHRFLKTLSRECGRHAVRIASKIIRDLADENLEHQMFRMFKRRLSNTLESDESDLPETMPDSEEWVITSHFEIPDNRREELNAILPSDTDTRVTFRTDRDAPFGITLAAGDHTIGWTIRDYLDAIESEFHTLLDREGISSGESAPDEAPTASDSDKNGGTSDVDEEKRPSGLDADNGLSDVDEDNGTSGAEKGGNSPGTDENSASQRADTEARTDGKT